MSDACFDFLFGGIGVRSIPVTFYARARDPWTIYESAFFAMPDMVDCPSCPSSIILSLRRPYMEIPSRASYLYRTINKTTKK